MTHIHSYLTFNGNCREAMNFYKSCLGGDLHFQTIGDSPLSEGMPAAMKACILHATLKRGSWMIMATDMVQERGLVKGNAVSLLLHCSSEEEFKIFYERLASGGSAAYTPEANFWGAFWGDLTDKFGINWLLHYEYAPSA